MSDKLRAIALVVGAALGLFAGGLFGTGIHIALSTTVRAKARSGWSLTPVVVPSRALVPGTVLQFEDITQRSIPEELATVSMVKPDSASYVINQPVRFPVAEGEPLLWAHFESAASQGSVQERLNRAAENKACSDELVRRGLGSTVKTSKDLRDSLRRGATR